MTRNIKYTRGHRRATSPVSQAHSPRHHMAKPHDNNSKENDSLPHKNHNEDDEIVHLLKKYALPAGIIMYFLTKEPTLLVLAVPIVTHFLEYRFPTKKISKSGDDD